MTDVSFVLLNRLSSARDTVNRQRALLQAEGTALTQCLSNHFNSIRAELAKRESELVAKHQLLHEYKSRVLNVQQNTLAEGVHRIDELLRTLNDMFYQSTDAELVQMEVYIRNRLRIVEKTAAKPNAVPCGECKPKYADCYCPCAQSGGLALMIRSDGAATNYQITTKMKQLIATYGYLVVDAMNHLPTPAFTVPLPPALAALNGSTATGSSAVPVSVPSTPSASALSFNAKATNSAYTSAAPNGSTDWNSVVAAVNQTGGAVVTSAGGAAGANPKAGLDQTLTNAETTCTIM